MTRICQIALLPPLLALVVAVSGALCAPIAKADHLEIRRAVTLKEEPNRDAAIVERLEPQMLIELLEGGEQTNGYYRAVGPETGRPGWVYRTFVRRHAGPLLGSAADAGRPGQGGENPPSNFAAAKRAAVGLWWDIGAESFYCGCPYRPATAAEKAIRSGNLWVGGADCPYEPKRPTTSAGNPNPRATRIEWEHVVPADWIATGFGCQDDTRAACRRIDGYEEAEGDLHNLVPAIGELNGDRSARLYGEIDGEDLEYGGCDFEVVTTGEGEPHVRGMAEPAPAVRGDIARIWFYMEETHGVEIPAANRTVLTSWADADPVDAAERARHGIIAARMGRSNRFLEE